MIAPASPRDHSHFLRLLFFAGIAVQACLCVLAWIFYKERMVLPDDANYLFELLSNNGGFAVFHNRFIAAPTQVLPWLAIRGGASLETVARLYSLNIALFFFTVYLVCGFAFRNHRIAIGCLLAQLLITTDTFYWTVSELPLCLALVFPLAAMLEQTQQHRPARTAGIATVMITIAFGHSLALFGVIFMLTLLWIRRPGCRRLVVRSGSIYTGALAVKAIFFRDPYDRGALGGLRNFARLFPDYLSTGSLSDFGARCSSDYLGLPLCGVIVAVWLLRRREMAALAVVTVSLTGYLLLITVSFPHRDPTGFYPENLAQPLAFMTAFSVTETLLRENFRRAAAFVLISAIPIAGVVRIIAARPRYADRLAWQRTMIERFSGRKVILPESAISPDNYLLSWSSPYEFWLLSSLEHGEAASIIITRMPEEALQRIGAERKAFLPAFGVYYYDQLPQRYFPFRDTTSVYSVR